MTRHIYKKKSKLVAHTRNDNRYNRGNKVTMNKCPICSYQSTLKEFSEGTKVWAECSHCSSSGYRAKINDHVLIEAVDIVCTITDANDTSDIHL